jgi:hypothetical protein
LSFDPTQAPLHEADLTDEEQTRLEWAGVHTIDQLQKLSEVGKGKEIERVASLPVDRLRQALARASQPQVHRIEPYGIAESLSTDGLPLVRVQGRNLIRNGTPRVLIAGEPVSILTATDQELLVAPAAHQFGGKLIIETSPAARAEVAFDLTPHLHRRFPTSTAASGEGS